MKKTALLIGILFFLVLALPIEAKNEKAKGLLSGTPAPQQKNKTQESVWERLKAKFPKLLPAGINQAEVVSISGTALPAEVVVSHEGREITLKLSQKTLILRKYGGQAALAELKKADLVSARGTWVDKETKAVLEVRVLRDLSLEKRRGTFWGKIKSLDADKKTFVLEVSKRGEQTVLVTAATKIVDRRQREIPFSSLAVGHRVRATGLWEVKAKEISEVRLIKDWSVGPKPSLTPTMIPTPIPSPSLTP